MKPLCTLFHSLLLSSLCSAPPTEIIVDSIVTGKSATTEASINETEYTIGMPCNHTCNEILFNVKCDAQTKTCECENDYPVPLARKNGCVQPIQLGDQCMYSESCVASDAYSTCIQVRFNAYCRCIAGYREVSAGRHFSSSCSKDIHIRITDLPALLVAISGIAVFSTIICFVLRLFVGKSRNTRPRPAITTRLLSTTEIAQVARSYHKPDRPTAYSRKGSRGVTVSTSRATAARAAAILLVSCRIQDKQEMINRKLSDVSSDAPLLERNVKDFPRSFSAKQFKRESDHRIARNRRQITNQPSTSCLEPLPPKIPELIKPRSLSCDNVSDYESVLEKMGESSRQFALERNTD